MGDLADLASKPLSVLLCAFMMLTWVQGASAEDDDYSLYVNPGDTAVNIESGNLTAAVPYEWPRIIFYHEADPFSPHFDVGISRLFLFNDSDGDGNFCRSEATAVCFLDSNHVTWNVSTVEHGYDPELGEYASFSMSCNVSAYTPDENETMLLPDFASAAFRFSISEMSSRVVNSEGAYTVMGRTEIVCSMALSVHGEVDATGIVVDQSLQGGGTTSMFLIKESDGQDEIVYTEASGRVDETELGDDFAHVMSEVSEPRQEVDFSKEDGTVQATYFLSSVAALGDGTTAAPESSYYTTGSGLVLDTVLPPLNGTTSPLTLNMSILLDESGFVGSVRDWVEEYFPYFVAAVALGVSALLVAWHLRMRRRRVESQKRTDEEDGVG